MPNGLDFYHSYFDFYFYWDSHWDSHWYSNQKDDKPKYEHSNYYYYYYWHNFEKKYATYAYKMKNAIFVIYFYV